RRAGRARPPRRERAGGAGHAGRRGRPPRRARRRERPGRAPGPGRAARRRRAHLAARGRGPGPAPRVNRRPNRVEMSRGSPRTKALEDKPPAGEAAKAAPERRFTTISGRPIERLYEPEDVAGIDYGRDLADPGHFPYTRGIHETMYRGKAWTMRQFAGFGTAAQTNARFKYLLEHGSHGLSIAFDLPTLMGRDPDHPLSLGEVGKCGVAVSPLPDM